MKEKLPINKGDSKQELIQVSENKWKIVSEEKAGEIEVKKNKAEKEASENKGIPENKPETPYEIKEAPLIPASFKKEINSETKAAPIEIAKEKTVLGNRDAAKSELEKSDPLYFKEKENNILRENFVKAQLELEKVKQAGGYDPEDFKAKKAPFEKSFEEAKKLYYEYLKNNEGSAVEQKSLFISEEFNKLQDIKISLRSEEEAKKSYFPFNAIKTIGNWYKEQSAKQKYIVAAALIGGGIFTGLTGGSALLLGAMGSTALVSRILSGAGTAVALETAIARGKGKKFGMHVGHKGLMEEKTTQEIEKIKQGITAESAADFFEKNEGKLSAASERLYKESKKLETQRALISGAMGAVMATGAFGEAIKNVMHYTGVDKAMKGAFDWAKEHLGFGGHKAAGAVGSAGAERAVAHTEEVHHYVGEVKSGGNITRAAFESGHQAGVSHERIMEAMKHSSVKDIHGNLISLDKADLVQPGVKLEFIPKGTMINNQPAVFDNFMVIEPKGGGGFGTALDLQGAKGGGIIEKTTNIEMQSGLKEPLDSQEVKRGGMIMDVNRIEAQFNKDNAFLLKKIPSGLKESIINSDKFIDMSFIEPEFNKLDFERQNNIIKFIAGKATTEYEKNIGEAAILSEKLHEHLYHSYLKNIAELIKRKVGSKFDVGILEHIKNMSVDDLHKSVKTITLTKGSSNPYLAYEGLSNFVKEYGFKEGKEGVFEVLGKIGNILRNK